MEGKEEGIFANALRGLSVAGNGTSTPGSMKVPGAVSSQRSRTTATTTTPSSSSSTYMNSNSISGAEALGAEDDDGDIAGSSGNSGSRVKASSTAVGAGGGGTTSTSTSSSSSSSSTGSGVPSTSTSSGMRIVASSSNNSNSATTTSTLPSSSSSSSSSSSPPFTPTPPATPSTTTTMPFSSPLPSFSSSSSNQGLPTGPIIRGSIRLDGKVWEDPDILPSRATKMQRLLEGRNLELDALRATSWNGIAAKYRIAVWQMLLGYLPLNRERQADSVARKQAEYQNFANALCGPRNMSNSNSNSSGGGAGGAGGGAGNDGTKNTTSASLGGAGTAGTGGGGVPLGEADAALLRQVLYDVKRMSPRTPILTVDTVQRSLERVLYVFAQRHFATGYVQGINDLASPFFLVFLAPYADPDAKSLDHIAPEILMGIEADVYWCLSRLIEGMQDHYMPSQPGIQRMIHQLRELVHRLDEQLVTHLEANSVEFHTFAFRWMNCLLLRELPLRLVIRLWDTYMAETRNNIKDGFGTFHVFVCAALLLKFRVKLKEMKFQDLLQFLHNLPTQDWSVKDVEELLSQAYVYMSSFEGSPSHLK